MEEEKTDKALELTYNGGEYLATRHNTSLFTFMGEMALLDHVYLAYEDSEEDEQVFGGYVWSDHKLYETLKNFIKDNDFPQHLNSNQVAQCDIDAFKAAHPDGKLNQPVLPKATYDQVEDLYFNPSFPEEWIDGSK